MISHDDIIGNETFYNSSGVKFDWGGNRRKFINSTYGTLAAHGQYPYVTPDLEGGIKKKTGGMVFISNHWTHFTVTKAEEEIALEWAQNRRAEIMIEMNGLDGGIPMIRVMSDHLKATNTISSLPSDAIAKIGRMDELRAELQQIDGALADGVINEADKTWVQTNLPTATRFFNWITSFFS